MDDGFGSLQCALGCFDGLARNLTAFLVGPELHQAGGYDFRQMALLVALGHFDGLVDLTVAQSASYCGSKCPRLLACRAECHGPVNHYSDGPAGHDEQNNDHAPRDESHLSP